MQIQKHLWQPSVSLTTEYHSQYSPMDSVLFVVSFSALLQAILPLYSRVTSPTYDYISATKAILNNMAKFISINTSYFFRNANVKKTKQHKTKQ